MTVAVLVNPTARRNRTKRNRLEDILAGRPDVLIERVENFSDLPGIVDHLVQKDVSAVIISGGDGTVQAIQTHLAESVSHDRLPRLAILPDGTTNMNAADIGVQNPRNRAVLERIAVPEYCMRTTTVKKRHTVRVDNPKGRPPQHGMFFGAGAIYRAVLMSHRDVHSKGLTGDWANAMTFGKALWQTLRKGDDLTNPDRIYQKTDMTIGTGDAVFDSGGHLLLLTTTLHRLVLNSRPFWNQDEEALKLTTVKFPATKLLSSLQPILYGGEKRNVDPAVYRSTAARRISLDCSLPFILDGEVIEKPDDGPLMLSLGPEFEYLYR